MGSNWLTMQPGPNWSKVIPKSQWRVTDLPTAPKTSDKVSQIFELPYRQFAVGWPPVCHQGLETSYAPQNGKASMIMCTS